MISPNYRNIKWIFCTKLNCTFSTFPNIIIILNILCLYSILDMSEDFRALPPASTQGILGSGIELTCTPPEGIPEPVVRWKKNGEFVDFASSIQRISISYNLCSIIWQNRFEFDQLKVLNNIFDIYLV